MIRPLLNKVVGLILLPVWIVGSVLAASRLMRAEERILNGEDTPDDLD